MKKLLIALLVVFALLFACIYIFIPSSLLISKSVYINCNSNGANRFLSEERNWQKWWPSSNSNPDSVLADTNRNFIYNNSSYNVTKIVHNGVEVSILNRNEFFKSNINIIHLSLDSIAINWECQTTSSLNPFKRIQQYREAVVIKNDMVVILDSLRTFLDKIENIYGIHIQKLSTLDTFLIASRAVFPNYPETKDVYNLVTRLKKHIDINSAIQTGVPIMNVTEVNNTQFELMVALPTNLPLKAENDIIYRRMVPGSFMAAEVRGGDYTVRRALDQLKLFMSDYQKTEMAIPFEQLVTDRILETDTTKWVTKIYQPSF